MGNEAKVLLALQKMQGKIEELEGQLNRVAKVREVVHVEPDTQALAAEAAKLVQLPPGPSEEAIAARAAKLVQLPAPEKPNEDAIAFKVLGQMPKPEPAAAPAPIDEKAIVTAVLEQIHIPNPDPVDVGAIVKKVLGKIPYNTFAAAPEVDEKRIVNKVLARIPKPKDGNSVERMKVERGNQLVYWINGKRRVAGEIKVPVMPQAFTPGGGAGLSSRVRNPAIAPEWERVVNSLNDLPVPDENGVITLEDNVNYRQGKVLNLDTLRLTGGSGSTWTANTALQTGIIYNGTDPLFTGSKAEFRDIVIVAPNASEVFNLTGTGVGDYLLLNTVLFAFAKKIATLNNINDLNLINCGSIELSEGAIDATGVGNWNTFRIAGFNVQSSSATFVGLDITGSLLSNVKVDAMVMSAPLGAIGILGDANDANITPFEVASFTNGGFVGGMTPVAGIDTDQDVRYIFRGNDDLMSSDITANPYLSTSVTVLTGTGNQGIFFKVNQGAWVSTKAKRLTVTTDGDIVNDLEYAIDIEINGSITVEKTGGGTAFIAARLVYNDDPLHPDSVASTNGTQNGQPTSVPLNGTFTLQPGDSVSIYVSNFDDDSDIICDASNFTSLREL